MTWRLPWVSRGRYDDMVAQCDEAKQGVLVMRGLCDVHHQTGGDNLIRSVKAEERAVRVEAQFADLLAKYHALKLQGASTPEPAHALPERKEDPVMAALNEATAGKGQKARKAALEQLKRDRADKLGDEEIILRIQRGNRPAEEFE